MFFSRKKVHYIVFEIQIPKKLTSLLIKDAAHYKVSVINTRLLHIKVILGKHKISKKATQKCLFGHLSYSECVESWFKYY